MMTREQALKLMAEAVNLPHGNFVRALSVETVMEKCNGVGAEWMAKIRLPGIGSLLDLANSVYAWARPASVRHDVRYAVGGTAAMRKNDDQCFLEDCLWLANADAWYNPRRYWRRHQARKLHAALRTCGWAAYSYDTDEERLADAAENSEEAEP